MQKFHFLIRFTKLGRARFLAHRELMTVWAQAVRRADIPLAFSEGFNPRPRLSFPSALGLGIESEDEVLFLHLAQWMRPVEITQRLADQLIEGIKVTQIEPVAAGQIPTCFEVTYKITWHRATRPAAEVIKKLLDQPDVFITRFKPQGSKQINIRPYLKGISIQDNEFTLVAHVTPQGTVRAEEIIPLLGLAGSLAQGDCSIRKLRTNFT